MRILSFMVGLFVAGILSAFNGGSIVRDPSPLVVGGDRPIIQGWFDAGYPIVVTQAVDADPVIIVDEDRILMANVGTTYTDYEWVFIPRNGNVISRTTSDDEVIIPDPDNLFNWLFVGTGTATITLETPGRTLNEEVTTLTGTSDEIPAFVSFVPGSVRDVAFAQAHAAVANYEDPTFTTDITDSIRGIFSTYNNSTQTYVFRENDFVDVWDGPLTSPWGSGQGNRRPGLPISLRHLLYSAHYWPAVGETVRFVAQDGTVHNRTIVARQRATGWVSSQPGTKDYGIVLLNDDLPETIGMYTFLPDGWADYIPSLSSTNTVPVWSFDQRKHLSVSAWRSAASSVLISLPSQPDLAKFYKTKVYLDSGSPIVLRLGDQSVLLGVYTFPTSGTNLALHKDEINDIMEALSTANDAPVYTLTEADFSDYWELGDPVPFLVYEGFNFNDGSFWTTGGSISDVVETGWTSNGTGGTLGGGRSAQNGGIVTSGKTYRVIASYSFTTDSAVLRMVNAHSLTPVLVEHSSHIDFTFTSNSNVLYFRVINGANGNTVITFSDLRVYELHVP